MEMMYTMMQQLVDNGQKRENDANMVRLNALEMPHFTGILVWFGLVGVCLPHSQPLPLYCGQRRGTAAETTPSPTS